MSGREKICRQLNEKKKKNDMTDGQVTRLVYSNL